MKRKYLNSQSGFTLVELLIVIVIIGILAGVVIGVLNPVQQQNRAKDGVTRSSMDKMALSAKSLVVSVPRTTNRAPTPSEFINSLGSVVDPSACLALNDATAQETCYFEVQGQRLPADCVTDYNGESGGTQCQYVYYRDGNLFRVAGRGAAAPKVVFVFHMEEFADGSVSEGFYNCPVDYSIDDDPSAACTLIE